MRDVIVNRLKYFEEINPIKIYNLYHSDSEFRSMFANEKEYIHHFGELIKIIKPIEINIYKENIYTKEEMIKKLENADSYTKNMYQIDENRDNYIGEILFSEKAILLENNEFIYLYTRTIFKKENDEWKIFKDIRDK